MNIKGIRESKNLTQYDLAALIGVNRSSVAMWETGEAMPRADKLVKLAEILGCTVDDLLKDSKSA